MQPNKMKQICIALLVGLFAFFAPNAVFAQAKAAFKPTTAAEWQQPGNTAEAVHAKKMIYIMANFADIKRIVAEEKRGNEIGISVQDLDDAARLLEAAQKQNPNPNVSIIPNN
jgi:hypothetical protein